MARAYSQDLRGWVITTALGGISVRQAAARYGVGVSTAILWVRRARSGEVSARRQGQPRGSKLDAHAAFLLELIEASSPISLHEMQAKLKQDRGVSAGIGTLWRFFHARAITVKKTAHACERDRPDVRAARRAWFDGQLDLDPDRLVVIDETGASTKMARLYGRCARGQRLRVGLPHGHWKTTTFVAGRRLSVIRRGVTMPIGAGVTDRSESIVCVKFCKAGRFIWAGQAASRNCAFLCSFRSSMLR